MLKGLWQNLLQGPGQNTGAQHEKGRIFWDCGVPLLKEIIPDRSGVRYSGQ